MLFRELWACPEPALGLLCRVHETPVWLWVFRFHSARSLGVEADEDELKLPDVWVEDAPDAEWRRYSLGEEVEALDLSTLPGTPSREVEM